jgi:hypothetical protein
MGPTPSCQRSCGRLAGSCREARSLVEIDSAAQGRRVTAAVVKHLLRGTSGFLAGVLGVALAWAGTGLASAWRDAAGAYAPCEQQRSRVSDLRHQWWRRNAGCHL